MKGTNLKSLREQLEAVLSPSLAPPQEASGFSSCFEGSDGPARVSRESKRGLPMSGPVPLPNFNESNASLGQSDYALGQSGLRGRGHRGGSDGLLRNSFARPAHLSWASPGDFEAPSATRLAWQDGDVRGSSSSIFFHAHDTRKNSGASNESVSSEVDKMQRITQRLGAGRGPPARSGKSAPSEQMVTTEDASQIPQLLQMLHAQVVATAATLEHCEESSSAVVGNISPSLQGFGASRATPARNGARTRLGQPVTRMPHVQVHPKLAASGDSDEPLSASVSSMPPIPQIFGASRAGEDTFVKSTASVSSTQQASGVNSDQVPQLLRMFYGHVNEAASSAERLLDLCKAHDAAQTMRAEAPEERYGMPSASSLPVPQFLSSITRPPAPRSRMSGAQPVEETHRPPPATMPPRHVPVENGKPTIELEREQLVAAFTTVCDLLQRQGLNDRRVQPSSQAQRRLHGHPCLDQSDEPLCASDHPPPGKSFEESGVDHDHTVWDTPEISSISHSSSEAGEPDQAGPRIRAYAKAKHPVATGTRFAELNVQGQMQYSMVDEFAFSTRGHDTGSCKPCLFWSKNLCSKDTECTFCHLPHSREQIRRIRPSKKTRVWLQKRARQIGQHEVEQDDESPICS